VDLRTDLPSGHPCTLRLWRIRLPSCLRPIRGLKMPPRGTWKGTSRGNRISALTNHVTAGRPGSRSPCMVWQVQLAVAELESGCGFCASGGEPRHPSLIHKCTRTCIAVEDVCRWQVECFSRRRRPRFLPHPKRCVYRAPARQDAKTRTQSPQIRVGNPETTHHLSLFRASNDAEADYRPDETEVWV
jgi:hypothetical protein